MTNSLSNTVIRKFSNDDCMLGFNYISAIKVSLLEFEWIKVLSTIKCKDVVHQMLVANFQHLQT